MTCVTALLGVSIVSDELFVGPNAVLRGEADQQSDEAIARLLASLVGHCYIVVQDSTLARRFYVGSPLCAGPDGIVIADLEMARKAMSMHDEWHNVCFSLRRPDSNPRLYLP